MLTCSRCDFTSDVKGICTTLSEIGDLDAVPCGVGLC